MIRDFVDFEVEFQPRADTGFPFSVQSERAGEERGILPVLTDDADYQVLKERLEALRTDEDLLVQIGQKLFDALFQGKVRDVYSRTQGTLQEGEGIRLKLNVSPTEVEVAALPWEFLYDPDQGPLAMLDTSIVRYPQQSVRISNLEAKLPLRVLLTAAQPKSIDSARADDELQAIKEALADQGLVRRQLIQIVEEPHLTRSQLQRRLRQGFHIWHFAGHGSLSPDGKTGRLYLEDAQGDAESISSVELGILLRGSGVRLIVLDACESARLGLATEPFRSMAPALIRNQVPAVVAMQFTIPEESTRAFATDFYNALAAGLPIDACVTEGRKAIMGATGLGRADWGIPVVYTRAPDGVLFELPAAPAPQITDVPSPIGQDNISPDSSRAADAVGMNPKKEPDQSSSAPSHMGTSERARLTMLRQMIATYFNEGELRDLCFDMGVDYESLPGQGKSDKARELVSFCERYRRIPELVALCARRRTGLSWPEISEEGEEHRSSSQAAASERPQEAASETSEAETLAEEIAELRQQMATKRERRRFLKNEEAMFGATVDPAIPMQIQRLDREIADLRQQLQKLEG